MDAVHAVLVIAHLAGVIALLVGGIASLVRPAGKLAPVLLWSARIQVVTGVVLAILAIAAPEEGESANYPKLAIKLLVALGVAGSAEVGTRRKSRALIAVAVVLTIVNAGIASAW